MAAGILIVLFFAMLWVMRRLDELKAGQAEIQAQLAALEDRLSRTDSSF